MFRTTMARLAAAVALTLAAAAPAAAQVEKAAMRTTGVSCGTCAVFSEIYLRQLPGIASVAISLSKEAVMVSYKPGAEFRPQDLRDALRKTDVGVVQLQISARGRLVEQGGKRFFVAGKDRFLIRADAPTPAIPPARTLLIEGIVDDRAQPMDLKVLTVSAVRP